MTRCAGSMSDPDDDHDRLDAAADAYRTHFGKAPAVYQFMDWQAALTRELLAAVARGELLTEAETYRRIGVTPPPDDAII